MRASVQVYIIMFMHTPQDLKEDTSHTPDVHLVGVVAVSEQTLGSTVPVTHHTPPCMPDTLHERAQKGPYLTLLKGINLSQV